MKTWLLLAVLCLPIGSAAADDFLRPLPDPRLCAQLTADKFPNADGVIIIKEQSLNVHQTEVFYRTVELTGLAMTRTTVMIAKVFDDAGVRRLGSFEYEYREYFGNEIASGFVARARVQKPDGTVITMPEGDVSIVVSLMDNAGDPLARKALFKVPDLKPDDIVQIEYVLTEPFVRAYSGIFYYQDQMPILYSNLAITCQARDVVRTFSFPADRIGEPKVSQIAETLGSGETRFWSVRNLPAIPKEPSAPPLKQLSMLTAFVVDKSPSKPMTWDIVGKNYFDHSVDNGSVRKLRMKELGVGDIPSPVTMETVGGLYTTLRTSLSLAPVNNVYPLDDELDKVFDKKQGDASDLSAIFYDILHGWKVDARCVLIRDRREGPFEQTVPTLQWFDRIGVLVRIGDREELYDFDRSVPTHFATPWFLKDITVMVIDGDATHPMTTAPGKPGDAWMKEIHDLVFTDSFALRDSMVSSAAGGPAEDLRSAAYDLKGKELDVFLQRTTAAKCIEGTGSILHAPLIDQRDISIGVTGTSKATVAVIDSFVSVRPANHALQTLQEEFLAPTRATDILLHEPYGMTIEWTVHHPNGYRLTGIPRDTTISNFPGAKGSLACERRGDDARITLQVDFSKHIVPREDYGSFTRLLAAMRRVSEQAVTFRKKSSVMQ